jgi:nitroreductase
MYPFNARRTPMAFEAILARRSIRTYTEEPVSGEEITKLLEAAMAAPSSRDRKPWHFVVVRDRATLMKLAEVHPHGKMLSGAAAAIAVCGDITISPDFWVQDCAAATENILIAVAALRLGAVWLGCHPRDDRVSAIKTVLGIPGHIGVLSLISIGRPGENKEPRTQYDGKRIHDEKW